MVKSSDAVAFWTHWSGYSLENGRAVRTQLQ